MSDDSKPYAPKPAPVVAHRFLLGLLRSPCGRLVGGLSELKFVGRVSGHDLAARARRPRGGPAVIYVGRASGKRWWRNFIDGLSVQVRVAGVSYQGHGRVVDVGHPDRAWAERTYRGSHSRVKLLPVDPMVVIDLAEPSAVGLA